VGLSLNYGSNVVHGGEPPHPNVDNGFIFVDVIFQMY
ncbi:unnamed protein product, partial [marine sediment metagenome]